MRGVTEAGANATGVVAVGDIHTRGALARMLRNRGWRRRAFSSMRDTGDLVDANESRPVQGNGPKEVLRRQPGCHGIER